MKNPTATRRGVGLGLGCARASSARGGLARGRVADRRGRALGAEGQVLLAFLAGRVDRVAGTVVAQQQVLGERVLDEGADRAASGRAPKSGL